jgi:hypothetical protein
MNPGKVDLTGTLSVADGAITTLLSTFHVDLQPAPIRRSGMVAPVRGATGMVTEVDMGLVLHPIAFLCNVER